MKANISKIVDEWSYRLSLIEDHDGFPDIESYSDLTVLKSVLTDHKWPVEITYELLYNIEHPESKLITEEPFSYSILGVTKKKYQPQWLDYINNGEEFELEPNGTAIIDKKILQLKGDNSTLTFKELLDGKGGKQDWIDWFKTNTNKIIPSNKGLLRLDQISKSTFTSKGGGDIPSDAATYEMGICMAHAIFNKGLSREDAFTKTKIKNPQRYNKFRAEVEDKVGKKIVSNSSIKSLPLIEHTGQGLSDSVVNPYSNNTPKTDIMATKSHRISLKKKGGSQLTSATGPEARGLFEGAKTFWGAEEDISGILDEIIKEVENKFKTITGDQEVGQIRNKFKEYYISVREPDVNKEAQVVLDKLLKVKKPNKDEKNLLKQLTGKLSGKRLNKKGIENHINAEARALGLLGGGDKPKWFIPNITVMKPTTTSKLFKDFLKTYDNKEMADEAREVLTTAIDHKNLKPIFDKVWNNNTFKKWVVYEAATGNFKFSGDSNLNSSQDSIANEIMVFDLGGGVTLDSLDVNWASKHASKVTSTVGYKSSGRSKNSSWRLNISEGAIPKQGTLFEHNMNMVIKKETEKLNNDINILVDSYVDMLEEGFFDNLKKKGKDLYDKVKKIASKLVSKIKDMIKNFYNNVLKKALENIKEFAKKGFDVLVDALGIEITGIVDVKVKL